MTNTPAERIGANVRAEMARHNISQTSLALQLSLSQASVSSRLRGEIAFDVNELHRVAGFLGVPVAVLLAEQPATTP
ncbi:helix-turn-helix domain-containing protein [Kribbella sp. WER1]